LVLGSRFPYMKIIVTVNSKNQITIPKSARRKLAIGPGDPLILRVEKESLIPKPKPKSYTKHLRGLHKDVWEGLDATEYIRKESLENGLMEPLGTSMESLEWSIDLTNIYPPTNLTRKGFSMISYPLREYPINEIPTPPTSTAKRYVIDREPAIGIKKKVVVSVPRMLPIVEMP